MRETEREKELGASGTSKLAAAAEEKKRFAWPKPRSVKLVPLSITGAGAQTVPDTGASVMDADPSRFSLFPATPTPL